MKHSKCRFYFFWASNSKITECHLSRRQNFQLVVVDFDRLDWRESEVGLQEFVGRKVLLDLLRSLDDVGGGGVGSEHVPILHIGSLLILAPVLKNTSQWAGVAYHKRF